MRRNEDLVAAADRDANELGQLCAARDRLEEELNAALDAEQTALSRIDGLVAAAERSTADIARLRAWKDRAQNALRQSNGRIGLLFTERDNLQERLVSAELAERDAASRAAADAARVSAAEQQSGGLAAQLADRERQLVVAARTRAQGEEEARRLSIANTEMRDSLQV